MDAKTVEQLITTIRAKRDWDDAKARNHAECPEVGYFEGRAYGYHRSALRLEHLLILNNRYPLTTAQISETITQLRRDHNFQRQNASEQDLDKWRWYHLGQAAAYDHCAQIVERELLDELAASDRHTS